MNNEDSSTHPFHPHPRTSRSLGLNDYRTIHQTHSRFQYFIRSTYKKFQTSFRHLIIHRYKIPNESSRVHVLGQHLSYIVRAPMHLFPSESCGHFCQILLVTFVCTRFNERYNRWNSLSFGRRLTNEINYQLDEINFPFTSRNLRISFFHHFSIWTKFSTCYYRRY